MRLRNIWIVYLKELTEALRDRRTLITTFLVPLLLIPVLGAGFTAVMAGVIGKAKSDDCGRNGFAGRGHSLTEISKNQSRSDDARLEKPNRRKRNSRCR
jgi:ABC-type Na+ efflux pump permease subunit